MLDLKATFLSVNLTGLASQLEANMTVMCWSLTFRTCAVASSDFSFYCLHVNMAC